MKDTIYRADAIEAVVCHIWHMPNETYRQFNCENIVREVVEDAIKRLPSAEAKPIVIRCKTLLGEDDFKRIAERIKEENKNVIVIPCDAEVVSAEDDWIPCSERLPDIGNRCLVTLSNNVVAIGTLHNENDKRWHLEPASMMIAYHEDSVTAWMPLPKPYKGGDTE